MLQIIRGNDVADEKCSFVAARGSHHGKYTAYKQTDISCTFMSYYLNNIEQTRASIHFLHHLRLKLCRLTAAYTCNFARKLYGSAENNHNNTQEIANF